MSDPFIFDNQFILKSPQNDRVIAGNNADKVDIDACFEGMVLKTVANTRNINEMKEYDEI
jgi:hypothetical protein